MTAVVNVAFGRRHRPDDVADLLLECHERIRRFLALAVRLGEGGDVPRADVAEAARSVRRYFAEAFPLHVADEERSVVPRLAGRSASLDEALAAMSVEHEAHVAALAELLTLCGRLAEAPELHATLAAPLRATAARLQVMLDAHLEVEERVIIPAIRELIDLVERKAMRDELRRRREPRAIAGSRAVGGDGSQTE